MKTFAELRRHEHESIAEQMQVVRFRYPDAKCEPLSHGRHLVTIPNFDLPEGWKIKDDAKFDGTVGIVFVLPNGFPSIAPDNFWSTDSIRLANGQTPMYSTERNKIPGYNGETGTWFGWMLQAWNPNRDTIWTYVAVIRRRFYEMK